MSADDRHHTEARVTGLVARLLGPVGPEVTCEQCFELIDQYVDLEVAGADADAALPGVRAHLEGCPACHEDHESLRELIGGTAASSAAGGRRIPPGRVDPLPPSSS